MMRKKKQDPVAALWYKLPPYVRNRYFLALVGFTVVMVFVDRHDVMTQFTLNRTVHRLEDDLIHYDQLIGDAEAEKMDMEQNKERFARESYYMQKDDEDVFIIVDDTEKEQ